MRYLLLVSLLLLGSVVAQPGRPLSSKDLIKLKNAGIDSQLVVKMIGSHGLTSDTTLDSILALQQEGLDPVVVRAALSALQPSTGSSGDDHPPSVRTQIEAGFFVEKSGASTPLPVEVPRQRSTGAMRAMATGGFGAVKMRGELSGSTSSLQLTAPITITLRCPEGLGAEDFQLISLQAKKDHREFTMSKMTPFGGMSTGPDSIPLRFEKVERGTFKAQLVNLNPGEYGFASRSAGATKVYTFGLKQ